MLNYEHFIAAEQSHLFVWLHCNVNKKKKEEKYCIMVLSILWLWKQL